MGLSELGFLGRVTHFRPPTNNPAQNPEFSFTVEPECLAEAQVPIPCWNNYSDLS